MAADLSVPRRKKIRTILRAERSDLRDLPEAARVMYVAGMLICNDVGRFTQAALYEALDDPSVVQVAKNLLREARV